MTIRDRSRFSPSPCAGAAAAGEPTALASSARRTPAHRAPARTLEIFWLGAALAALSVAPPAAARAQVVTATGAAPATLTHDEALEPGDPSANRMGRFRAYPFEGRQGSRYLVRLGSAEFDPVLSVARAVSGITDFLVSREGSRGSDAQLVFEPPADGRYLLVAQALHTDGLGAFSLRVDELPDPFATVRPVQIGSTVEGVLSHRSAAFDDGSFYNVYEFEGQAGERISITMESPFVDAYLIVSYDDGTEQEVIGRDDDGGGGTDALVRLTLPRTGRYTVVATSYEGGETGDYRLTIAERPDAGEARPRRLELGRPIVSELTDALPTFEYDQFYESWEYPARAGERIVITMRSAEFDTFLWLGRVRDGEFEELAFDDDGEDPDGTNSRLEFTFPASGTYVVRATSFGSGEVGVYTIEARAP